LEITLSDVEFSRFQRFIHEAAGIAMSDAKKSLVSSRLAGRVRARELPSFGEYFRLITSGHEDLEMQTAVDLLTTNETYFFREPKHFEFLHKLLDAGVPKGRPFRVWSAASSTGEEAYSVAMLLADRLGDAPWEIFGSDLSTRVIARARMGHFSMERADLLPQQYLKRFCLKGTGPQAGTLLVAGELRARVTFDQVNLAQPLPNVGLFDVIFLRNVMIYFDKETKSAVVSRLLNALVPGGHFLIGHTETLHGINNDLESVATAIYRKPERP
jgi:chemotaxis protein methyltransferase CheR